MKFNEFLGLMHPYFRGKHGENKKFRPKFGSPKALDCGFFNNKNPYINSRSGRRAMFSSGPVCDIDHRQVRDEVRDVWQVSKEARAIINRKVDTVVGSGLRLEAMPMVELLGLTQEEGEEWAEDVEARWQVFTSDKKQHRAENFDFQQAQRLYMLFYERDNDVFSRLFYSNDPELISPLQFQFIDPYQIKNDAFTSTEGYISSRDGIKRDERGREVSFSVDIVDHKNPGAYKCVDIPKKGKSGRVHMLHGFKPEYAGQERGYSGLAFAIQELEKVTRFTEAQIQKAISQSNFLGFVEPSKDAPASDPLAGAFNNGGVGCFEEATENATEDETTSGYAERWQELPEEILDKAGSKFITTLDSGETIKFVQDSAAAQDYKNFVDTLVSGISSANSIPYEVVTYQFSNNYSASRATLILYWEVVKILRNEMASDFLNPMYEMWLSEEIAAGRIVAPGFSDPVLKRAWLHAQWIGPSMPNIDPLKSAMADKAMLEIGATTPNQIALNHNGTSGASNRAKNKRQSEELVPWIWMKTTPKSGNDNERN